MQPVRTVTKIEANPLLTANKNEYKQLNVAAYCRVSTDSDDQLQSYEAQVAYYTDHICKNPKWHFVGIYADEGITGTVVSKRERFKDMIRDCEKGKIDLILTKSVSRFARNTVDSLNYVRKLKAMNIGVFFEEQNIDTLTTDSEMFIGLYSVMAQSESENISANIKWGVRQRMKNGTFSFNYNTYGYRKGDNGEPEIVPEEAYFIKKIFELYLDGYSTRDIANYINSQGARTRRGNEWRPTNVQDALSNEKYVGDMLMQKTFSYDCIAKKKKKNNGELPKYLISNNHKPIIDRETFKMAQSEKAKRNSKRKKSSKGSTVAGRYDSKYALSDVLICGECGSSYVRRLKYYNGKKMVYWRCLNRIENGTKFCSKSSGIREEQLHAAICRAISKISPSKEEVFIDMKATLEYAVTQDENSLNKYNIELNIKQLQDEAEDYMMKAATTEGDKSKYYDEVERIFSKVKALREQLEIIEASSSKEKSNSSEMNRISNIFENTDFTLSEYDDLIVRRLIECIRVMSDKRIVIIFKGGYEITESLLD
ncbi:MAG: recombinase family protein [Acutalibacteraceae bacterium]